VPHGRRWDSRGQSMPLFLRKHEEPTVRLGVSPAASPILGHPAGTRVGRAAGARSFACQPVHSLAAPIECRLRADRRSKFSGNSPQVVVFKFQFPRRHASRAWRLRRDSTAARSRPARRVRRVGAPRLAITVLLHSAGPTRWTAIRQTVGAHRLDRLLGRPRRLRTLEVVLR
jgi:hypothetical protein